jgi:uncharacterized membrane protein YkvA (DUF1232 family)
MWEQWAANYMKTEIGSYEAKTKLPELLRQVKVGESTIIAEAQALLARAKAASLPNFIRERFDDVESMIEMLRDADWNMTGPDRQRVVTGLTYFAEPLDLIPDSIPGIGFLDDAVMVELIVRELREEIAGYRDFASFRERRRALGQSDVDRKKWLEQKRRDVIARIKRRRAERRRHYSTSPLILRTK